MQGLTGRHLVENLLRPNLLLTAKNLENRVLAMDLHSAQIQGYFDIPCDHIYGSRLIDYLDSLNLEEIVVVSPDVGGVARARAFAKQMKDAPLAIIDKEEQHKCRGLTVIGEVKGKTAILIDDMIDTGSAICSGANLLKKEGANKIFACASHAVFSPPSYERLSTKIYSSR